MGIRVFGAGTPPPLGQFQALGELDFSWLQSIFAAAGGSGDVEAALRPSLLALQRNIENGKWKEPMPVQMQTIPILLQGRDALAAAPTGSGKTGSFGVPIILAAAAARVGLHQARSASDPPRSTSNAYAQLAALLPTDHVPRAVVLAPTQELAGQLASELSRLAAGTGIRVTHLTRPRALGAYGVWAPLEASMGLGGGSSAPTTAASGHGGGSSLRSKHGEAVQSDSGSEDGGSGSEAEEAAKPRTSGGRKRAETVKSDYRNARLPLVDVLVSTPQRLRWVLDAAPAGVAEAMLSGLITVALDECDQLLLHSSFVQQVDAVLAHVPQREGVAGSCVGAFPSQRVLVSATMPSSVVDLSVALLRDSLSVQVGKQFATAPNVEQKLLFVGKEEGKLLEMRQMAASGFEPPTLVFVQSKERAAQLVDELSGVFPAHRVAGIHSSMPARKREAAINNFRTGAVWVLVTTELLGRGLDFKGVNTVINYDFPTTSVSYVHRVGRTGRGKRRGKAITFFTEADISSLRMIANVMRHSGCEVPEWMLQLKQPTRKQRRDLARKPPKRKPISTTAIYDRKVAEAEKEQARRAAIQAHSAATLSAANGSGAWQSADKHNAVGGDEDGGGWQSAAVFNAEEDE